MLIASLSFLNLPKAQTEDNSTLLDRPNALLTQILVAIAVYKRFHSHLRKTC